MCSERRARSFSLITVVEKANQLLDESYLGDAALEQVAKLEDIAKQSGMSLSQLAITWILKQPGISPAIVGANCLSRFKDTKKRKYVLSGFLFTLDKFNRSSSLNNKCEVSFSQQKNANERSKDLMRNYLKHYINGEWIDSEGSETMEVINPATEEVMGHISVGTRQDLDKAVQAAQEAFPSFSQTSREYRVDLLEQIATEYEKRKGDLIEVMTEELGSPRTFSEEVHYMMGYNHFKQAAAELRTFPFSEKREASTILKEPIGVSGLITPWNFPTNQTSTKIASAFAASSTVVLKPAELTPYAAMILAEIFEAAGLPKGVFNLVNGTGEGIGNAISSHPDIDFVSYTGSGVAGRKVMENAAEDIKKVTLELGGKSPMVVLDDADVHEAAKTAASYIGDNTGQDCSAATRVLVPESMKSQFEKEIKAIVESMTVGDPQKNYRMGPLVAQKQWDRVEGYIQKGVDEGATILTGGTGKPEGLETGYYVKPTVFTDVDNRMTIAQEEIFGPVTTIISYDTLNEALEISNDTVYGLAGYVIGKDTEKIRKVAKGFRAGSIVVNEAPSDFSTPFGGYKQSGIGREWGDYGIEEYLETKAVMGMPD